MGVTVFVTNVQASGNIGAVSTWSEIIDSQTPNWSVIPV